MSVKLAPKGDICTDLSEIWYRRAHTNAVLRADYCPLISEGVWEWFPFFKKLGMCMYPAASFAATRSCLSLVHIARTKLN